MLPNGEYSDEDRLKIWAADPAGHGRPVWTVVAMAATAWCSVLEGFIRGIALTAIDSTALSRVRAAFPDAEIEWASLDRAKTQIVQRMLPSTKQKGKSMRYIE